jgi:hypothetical protein
MFLIEAGDDHGQFDRWGDLHTGSLGHLVSRST